MKKTLKKLSAYLMAIALITLSGVEASAQVPQKFNYQGIARDAKGNPMSQQRMTLKLTVLPTSDATEGEYEEIQTVTTNEFGLYTLQIGNGTPVTGEMKAVKWETGNKYIKVAIDPKGGNDFVEAGTNQLLSVPYAIYADKAGMAKTSGGDRLGAVSTAAAGTGTPNYVTKFTAANTIYNSQIFDNGTNVGIGTTTPAAKFHIQSGPIADMRITSTGSGASDYATMQLFNNTGNSFGFTKASSAGGLYSPGIPRPNLALLANSGALLFNATGNIGFATRIGGSNFTRMFIDSATGNVGINTVTPSTRLDVNGQIRMQGGAPGAGKVLTSDATGLATWTTPSITSVGGTTNYIPKYTPNGTTLGNSLLKDSLGLMYNINQPNTSINGVNTSTDFSFRGNKNAFVINKNAAGENQLIMTHPTNNIILMGDSTKLQNGGLFDSISFISNNTPTNTTFIGGYSSGLGIKNSDGRMANKFLLGGINSNAHFTINSSYDTAGHFTSSSTNSLYNGILRSEYTGTTVSDHVAIYGRSLPDATTNYGIGVIGEGGYYGVQGNSYITGSSNYGVSGTAISDGNSYGLTGYAGDNTTTGGIKYGTYTSAAGGTNNYGLYATVQAFGAGNGTGVYAQGKQTGVYGQADSASASQTNWMGTSLGYKEAIGVMGKGNMVSSPSITANIGVAGSATSTGNWFNVGVFGEAVNAGSNYAIFGRAPAAASSYAGYFLGNVNITGSIAKASGTFKIDHPQDPANKYLIHSFVESPDMMNVYNGNTTTDANGIATVSLPSYFEAENKDFKYQLTVVDNSADFVMAKVSEKVSNNTFKIKTSKPNVEVSWQVTGVRQDAYANAHRIVDVVDKAPEDRGYYIHPELFGAPSTQVVGPMKGNPNAERHLLPSPEDHKKAMEEKKRVDDEHLQKQQEAQKNWKQQEAPKQDKQKVTGASLTR